MSQIREFIREIYGIFVSPERQKMRKALRYWTVDMGPITWRRY